MPNQPKTPNRAVRIDDELWQAALAAAADQGVTVSDVVRIALGRFVSEHTALQNRPDLPERPCPRSSQSHAAHAYTLGARSYRCTGRTKEKTP